MKRALTGMACAAVLVIAGATQSSARAQGAIVIDGGVCGLLDGDGGFAVGEVHSVQTSGGVTNYMCKAKRVKNEQQANIDYDYSTTGLACMTKDGPTTDWSESVSSTGNATLHCHMKH